MFRQSNTGKRIIKLIEAFSSDGFEAVKIIKKFGKTGIMAESRTAYNYDTHQKKKAYYLEGTPYEMGFLLGSLAENEISSMTGDFTGKIVFEFIHSKALEKIKVLQDIFVRLMYELSKSEFTKLPQAFKDELQGVLDGCKSNNPKTTVTMERLVVLNIGIDILCSMVYSGSFPLFRLQDFEPEDFRIPIMCNAFSVFGVSAGGGHYFGRDFMFPSADVFHTTAAMIIYNPTLSDAGKTYPFIGITAPGIIGCISAMNINGVGIGVDMSPGANCNPKNIGVNSLLMARLCAQNGGSAVEFVKIIKDTPRGVTWNYIVADGRNDRACVVETGSSESSRDFNSYASDKYKDQLPDASFLSSHRSEEFDRGIMVRWNDFKYPEDFLGFNEVLWKRYDELNNTELKPGPDAFLETGFINRTPDDHNCPSAFYFAPQREKNDELVVVTNHYIIPEMRYYAMHKWTSRITSYINNNIQWRYDELNSLILKVIQQKGAIDFESARTIIDYLSPKRTYPTYYADNPKSMDGKEIRIEGCVSIFDLKNLQVESHYGYYCDEWVKLSLSNYVE